MVAGAGGAKQPKTRFSRRDRCLYDRFRENQFCNTRFDGTSQLNFNIFSTESDRSDAQPRSPFIAPWVYIKSRDNIATTAQIAAAVPFSSTIRQVCERSANALHDPGRDRLERQLPFKTTMGLLHWFKDEQFASHAHINAPVA